MANETIPTCDICGYPCRYGYDRRQRGRDRFTDYEDEEIVCSECIQGEAEEGYMLDAADAAYDMEVEG
jgi:hypothetical protein